MSFPEALRLVNIVVALICLAAFAPAITHARDNVDRLYLFGGAVLLIGGGVGSYQHLHDRFRVSVVLVLIGEVIWLASAYLSRRRRRRLAGK